MTTKQYICSYFQLKCSTLMFLISNVVYKFTRSCDTNGTYVVMTTGNFGVRIGKHLRSLKIQQYKNTLIFASHARVTYLFSSIFLFLKHAALNTAQKSKMRYQLKNIIQTLTHSYVVVILFFC